MNQLTTGSKNHLKNVWPKNIPAYGNRREVTSPNGHLYSEWFSDPESRGLTQNRFPIENMKTHGVGKCNRMDMNIFRTLTGLPFYNLSQTVCLVYGSFVTICRLSVMHAQKE